MSDNLFTPDKQRFERIGLDEAVFCHGKTAAQIDAIVADAVSSKATLLLTRLDESKFAQLQSAHRATLDYDEHSITAVLGQTPSVDSRLKVAVVTGGTSDLRVAGECTRTLGYHGVANIGINDVGVAGLHRLLARLDDIKACDVVIAIAGMDAALPTVLGGLIGLPIIAVPTSVGYGVAKGGHTALNALLASCASGLTVVNIDNGYGAACAAIRTINCMTNRMISRTIEPADTYR